MANIYHDDEDGKLGFSSFKTIGEVLKAFQVTYTEANFISELALIPTPKA